MTAKIRQRLIYLAGDTVSTAGAMLLFNVVRYHCFIEQQSPSVWGFMSLSPVIFSIAGTTLLMLAIYALSGFYYNMLFRSRIEEVLNTLGTTLLGTLLVYLAVLGNDRIDDRGTLLEMVGTLWGLMFGCVYAVRFCVTQVVVKKVHNRRLSWPTYVVGTSQSAVNLVDRLNKMRKSMGFKVVGYVATEADTPRDDLDLPVHALDDIREAAKRDGVVKLIVLPHRNGIHATMELISRLFPLGIEIHVSPELFQLISGRQPFGNVAGEPLIDISSAHISPATASMKRGADMVCSAIALVLLAPVFLVIGAAVKIDSRGPVFYRQERVGFRKKRFKIVKFRSMCSDAEADGPALSSTDDPRVTRVGRFLRKYRLDELPQFYNVLVGQMSLVGPRPEREYYVKRIVERVPYYSLIHSVRPGITSWGMVKYGYASTVDQMIERLRYDLIYIENVSMGVDLKIIIYTVKTVLTGQGL